MGRITDPSGDAMVKTVTFIAAAALVAGAISVFPGASQDADASTPVPVTKGDRLDRPAATACTQQAWPHIGADCLKDPSRNGGRAKHVRTVSTDRMPAVR